VAERIQKFLSHVSPYVTLKANTADVLTPIVEFKCPRGLSWVIPGRFPLILKLQKTDGSEIKGVSEIYWGLTTPSDPRRIYHVGAHNFYQPWADLSLDKQRDIDYEAALMIDLGIPFLPLQEEEAMFVQLYSADTIDTTKVIIYVPYFERAPSEIAEELGVRAELVKV